MELFSLPNMLIFIGILVGPGSPGPIREIIAIPLALFLPEFIINPVNSLTKIIFPPIVRFEAYMSRYERIRTILPRFMAAEVILIVIGAIMITIGKVIA